MTVQELYDRIGGDYDAAKRILPMDKLIAKFVVKFLDDQSFAKLAAGWESKDPAGIFDGAHAIKGVCANLGLMRLSAQASALAEEYRPGNARTMDDAEVERRIGELTAEYEQALEGIRAFAAEQ